MLKPQKIKGVRRCKLFPKDPRASLFSLYTFPAYRRLYKSLDFHIRWISQRFTQQKETRPKRKFTVSCFCNFSASICQFVVFPRSYVGRSEKWHGEKGHISTAVSPILCLFKLSSEAAKWEMWKKKSRNQPQQWVQKNKIQKCPTRTFSTECAECVLLLQLN